MPSTDGKIIPAVGAQVALSVAASNRQCALIGFVGNDEIGAALLDQLQCAGVRKQQRFTGSLRALFTVRMKKVFKYSRSQSLCPNQSVP